MQTPSYAAPWRVILGAIVLTSTIVGSLDAQAPTLFSPAEAATGSGNSINSSPFGVSPRTYQQIHSASTFSSAGPLQINRMRFQPDGSAPAGSIELEIRIADCPHPAEQASNTYAQNVVAGTELVAFSRRTVQMPAVQFPTVWNLDFPFDAPFSWAGSHLSWRIDTFTTGPTRYSVDAWGPFGTSSTIGSFNGCQSALGTAPAAHFTAVRGPGSNADFWGESYVAAGGLPAVLVIGATEPPAPVDLGAAGAPGCFLMIDLVAILGSMTAAGPTGEAMWTVATPANPLLTGAVFKSQVAFAQNGANGLGVFLTNAENTAIGINRSVARISGTSPTSGGVELHYALGVGFN
jgi:hypothetical protein